ncbi:hypothetical protein H5V45_18830 [Nocardioides sp. KIGAM211]|uniref:DUF4352 domain-containing protein n=1 Tax=Nocardioides luti TaxID=2761101 RepID=A0A7X0RLQ0_9ACTN|nr:hypothetical protein [Nocardioides luti]MBB6629389.1 hypothetical protein [Nocardioides luti]
MFALPSRLAALALAGALVLTGCSGSDDSPKADPSTSSSTSASGSTSPSAEDSPYLPVPDGVELTPQGSELKVGEKATVAYEPRQDTVGVLDITIDRIEETTFKKSFAGWKLDKATKKTTPYFVRATITNVGDTDLGGRDVPLYIVDGNNTLIEASAFASTFKPCMPGTFPKKFKQGKTADVCLVYLSPDHGELTAVSFRPTQDFDPITWEGQLKEPKPVGNGGAKGG